MFRFLVVRQEPKFNIACVLFGHWALAMLDRRLQLGEEERNNFTNSPKTLKPMTSPLAWCNKYHVFLMDIVGVNRALRRQFKNDCPSNNHGSVKHEPLRDNGFAQNLVIFHWTTITKESVHSRNHSEKVLLLGRMTGLQVYELFAISMFSVILQWSGLNWCLTHATLITSPSLSPWDGTQQHWEVQETLAPWLHHDLRRFCHSSLTAFTYSLYYVYFSLSYLVICF